MLIQIPVNLLFCAKQFSNKIILSYEQSDAFLKNCPDSFFDTGIELIPYASIKDRDGRVMDSLYPLVMEHNMHYWPISSHEDNVLNNPKFICSELNSDAIRYLSSILGTKAPELNPLLEWMKKNSTDSWLIVGLFDANFSVSGKNISINKLHVDLSQYILARLP